jgi:histidine ammonia-lyase
MESTNTFIIEDGYLSLSELYSIIYQRSPLELSEETIKKVKKGRDYLDAKMAKQEGAIYGINTGFGSLCDVAIEGKDLEKLQVNLVRSHACGTGAVIDPSFVRTMLFLKAKAFSQGKSGVRVELLEQLIFFYNNEILPQVFEQGSLGASGDLAPLAHLSLALMGEGEVFYEEEWCDSLEVLNKIGRSPIKLKSKEGLALLNGTQFMLGLGINGYFEAKKLVYLADLVAALSLDAFDGRPEPFDPLIHYARPHKGQVHTAAFILDILSGSEIIGQKKKHVQDPYSFRCVPQVHGASKDLMSYVASVFETELNSVTDNPTVFAEEDKIISGGNFHGQPLALALDSFALAIAELGSISERRCYLLISGQRDLPAFLVAKPGLNNGLMIAQYTAASIVSQNKQLCTPASVDSIVSSNGQEDHVSMGANAATKLQKVLDNLKTILAIELLTASQALFFREAKTSPYLESFLSAFREDIPFIEEDRIIQKDIMKARKFIDSLNIDSQVLFNE